MNNCGIYKEQVSQEQILDCISLLFLFLGACHNSMKYISMCSVETLEMQTSHIDWDYISTSGAEDLVKMIKAEKCQQIVILHAIASQKHHMYCFIFQYVINPK